MPRYCGSSEQWHNIQYDESISVPSSGNFLNPIFFNQILLPLRNENGVPGRSSPEHADKRPKNQTACSADNLFRRRWGVKAFAG